MSNCSHYGTEMDWFTDWSVDQTVEPFHHAHGDIHATGMYFTIRAAPASRVLIIYIYPGGLWSGGSNLLQMLWVKIKSNMIWTVILFQVKSV